MRKQFRAMSCWDRWTTDTPYTSSFFEANGTFWIMETWKNNTLQKKYVEFDTASDVVVMNFNIQIG